MNSVAQHRSIFLLFIALILYPPFATNMAINAQNHDQVVDEVDKAVDYKNVASKNQSKKKEPIDITKLIIQNIIIEGAAHVPQEAILNRIPYRVGEIFSPQKTNKLIRNIYNLGYFRNVTVYAQSISPAYMNLIIEVEEKKLLECVVWKGNKHLSEKEIAKKIDFSKIVAIDEDDLPGYIAKLKRLYREKDYHDVQINARIEGGTEHAQLIFDIHEGSQTLIKMVCFEGNKTFTAKKLRSLLFTREDWALGFLDRSGSYQLEAIQADKQVIENYYQSNGFLNARVTNVACAMDPLVKGLVVTFHVYEGDQYRISNIHIPGNDLVAEEDLLARLPMKIGDLYSKDNVRLTLDALRVLWGSKGYINADVEPSIQPNEENKTVALGFYTDLGKPIYLNRLNIMGNYKTYDKVIRRQISLEEGCLITAQGMDDSKLRVEGLGYFDTKGGVNWRMHRLSDDKIDLDLILREVKTGRFELQMSFGGSQRDISSPAESFTVGCTLTETNLFGRGIQVNASASFAREERNVILNLTNPWLFDRPIHSSFDVYFKRSLYDEFKFIEQSQINERITGGGITIGALSAKLANSTVAGKIGVDGITYEQTPVVKSDGLTKEEREQLQGIFDRRFTSGAFLWLGLTAFKDVRNHPMHPSRGYQYAAVSRVCFHSTLKDNPKDSASQQATLDKERTKFGFGKFDFDASWYTPLIGERDLVLGLHGHLGLIAPFKNKSVPFRELYHVGGPTSVRGFLYGEIGPMFKGASQKDMIGAKKAFWLNAELIFPITSDFGMKGAVFYDGGAGWDTPDSYIISPKNLINNNFSFRHSIGIGVRILQPTPVKIDWGFKLDRKRGETPSEVHFSMYHDF